MDVWNLVAGGAVFGVIASCWDKIKAVVWRIANLFIQQVEIPSEAAHNAVVAYLIANYRRSRFYDRMYGANYEHHRDGRYGLVPYELFGSRTMVFWQGCWPFLFSNEQENRARSTKGKGEGGNSSSDVHKVYSTVTFLRGTVNVERIVKDACACSNNLSWTVTSAQEKAKNRFVIHFVPKRGEEDSGSHESNGLAWYQQGYYRLLEHSPDQLGKAKAYSGSALGNLIFPQRIKNLIKEIELWRNHRQWYVEKGIPWKRGWLLYGPPGTGKTALARAFAEDLNMPIYVYNLAEMSNHELMRTWTEMQVNVPCIALIEDIDNVFHGRENVARKHGMMPYFLPRQREDNGDNNENGRGRDMFTPLTFDCLLNCLDGVERSDGVFAIISTNDIAKVDPALGQPRKLPDGTTEFISTRPGRIDKAVELTFMEAGDKKLMAQRILGDYANEYQEMLAFVERYPDLQETPAQFQERCAQKALARFWREKEAKLLDQPRRRKVSPQIDVDAISKHVAQVYLMN